MRKVILSFLIIVGCTAAVPVPNEDWLQLGKPGSNSELVLTFAIKRTNPGWLDEKLRAVSYPDSPDYGKYMNFDEIAEYVHGRPESVRAVVDALASVEVGMEGINFTLGMDFAVVAIPVAAAETLFSAQFYVFQHSKKTHWTVVRCLSYTVPESLTEHLDFVFGLTEFPATDVETKANCYPPVQSVNPTVINKAYNLSGYVSTNSSNSQAVSGIGGGGVNFSPADLVAFQKKYNVTPSPVIIVGPNNATNPGTEITADLEYISTVGRDVPTWYFEQADGNFLNWIVGLVNTTNAPYVHSVSYGLAESIPSFDFLERCDEEFRKFGISGRTLIVVTGDHGAPGQCTNQKFVPGWPATSAYVTSVGGTLFDNKEAWTCGGGGFSNSFPMPPYQKTAVEAYLKSGKAPNTTYFNPTGRAYPDVSAFALNFEITKRSEASDLTTEFY